MKTDIGKGFYLAPSMRLDDNKRYTDQFSPGLAIVWEQSYEWKASAKFSRSWQAPTFADMYNPVRLMKIYIQRDLIKANFPLSGVAKKAYGHGFLFTTPT